ncbi:MAG: hypothetical protein J0L92_21475 [Deltaproteobacteria bacterium]|nr:hypothetical protein [Deltaproteobacteria bacterium]
MTCVVDEEVDRGGFARIVEALQSHGVALHVDEVTLRPRICVERLIEDGNRRTIWLYPKDPHSEAPDLRFVRGSWHQNAEASRNTDFAWADTDERVLRIATLWLIDQVGLDVLHAETSRRAE